MDLCAVRQPVFQADVQEASLGAGHPLQEGQQRHRLFAFVPALEPFRQDANLVSEHHGASPSRGETRQRRRGEEEGALEDTEETSLVPLEVGLIGGSPGIPSDWTEGPSHGSGAEGACRQVGCDWY